MFCFINQLGGRRYRAHIMLNGAKIHAAEGVDFILLLQYTPHNLKEGYRIILSRPVGHNIWWVYCQNRSLRT